MKQLEIEFKTLLTAADYQKLCNYYQLTDTDFHTQTNVYFDTNDRQLQHLGCALRIRQYATTAELTLKTPQTVGLLETTDTLPVALAKDCIKKQKVLDAGAVYEELQRLQIAPEQLQLLAELTTKRAEFKIPEGLLAIDESWYEQGHDYELELEVVDDQLGKSEFDAFLARFDLSYQPAKNKIARATGQV